MIFISTKITKNTLLKTTFFFFFLNPRSVPRHSAGVDSRPLPSRRGGQGHERTLSHDDERQRYTRHGIISVWWYNRDDRPWPHRCHRSLYSEGGGIRYWLLRTVVSIGV